jgi:hypothetical protein
MSVVQFGHPEAFVRSPDSLNATIVFSGVIGPLVQVRASNIIVLFNEPSVTKIFQVFFADRVRIVSGKKHIAIVCWFLSSLRFIGSIFAAVKGFQMVTLAQYEAEWKWLLTTVLAVGAAVDVTVAVSLCYYLNQQKTGSLKRSGCLNLENATA